MATGPVAEVAYELDGREVVRLSGSRTWKQDVDFGPEYSPHELVARAYDTAGKEVALARQWVNLPRPPAEVEIALERDKNGLATVAVLAWASRMGPRPTNATLTFDGHDLPLDGAHRATLLPYDPTLPHVVSARVEFPGDIHGQADLVLGGGKADEAGSQLTAIPVRCAKSMLPTAQSLQGRFQKGGGPLRVTAVEREPARVMVVRDPDEGREAFRHYRAYLPNLPVETMLEKGDLLQVVWPVASQVPDQDALNVIFETLPAFSGLQANFLHALLYRGNAIGSPRRFADAVGVAGISAASTGSRRAVVLVLGEMDFDHSRRDAASIRRYLERIHVPLYVWSLVDPRPSSAPLAAAWGKFEDVSTPSKLRAAANSVQQDLRSQCVVWLEGRHLPQDIALVETGDGLEIAR